MALGPGVRIGPYEVTVLIGRGGMGEVHRARDMNLGREVAIKVLPDTFASDPDRLGRFEREARTLAALNHPNIAAVYGLETIGDTRALVMELVDGSTLADQIALGPIPIDEAQHIATQIADALEAAHDHGVIHRDLKPANVKVRPDGTVKVLDFGLAKALEPAEATSGLSMSPTITTPAMTRAGMILGTAAYMSPEQARGKPVDRRADIWAFGCVLFEMLAGRRPFAEEETVSDTLAGILKGEPAWDALPADTSPRLRALLERCLRKDPRRRLSHIAEARIAIEDGQVDVAAIAPPRPSAGRGWRLLWPVVAAIAGATAGAFAFWMVFTPVVDRVPARFEIPPPPGAIPMTGVFNRVMEVGEPISPDGRTVAFIATYRGRPSIWVRSLDLLTARPLSGTEGAERPVWSPDSQSLAFHAEGRLMRIRLAGGPATFITNTVARNLSWGAQNVILLGGEQGKPLLRVPADGGNAVPVTTLLEGETVHDYPHFLPDGRTFLFMERHGSTEADWEVYAASFDSSERHLLRGIHAGTRYSPTGHLLFVQRGQLMAVPFDLGRLELTGEPFRLSDGLSAGPRPPFSLARNGTFAYLTAPDAPESQLTWFNRTGRPLGTLGPAGDYNHVRLSLDGLLVAFDQAGAGGQGTDILTLDIERDGQINKVVSLPGADFAPVFSPDGNRIAFGSSRVPATNAGTFNASAGHLYTKALGALGDGELLYSHDRGKTPTDWSRDGRYLAYIMDDDVWALPMPQSPGAQPVRVTNTPYAESQSVFSPDGGWIAYQSAEATAGQDVYVQSFPDGARRILVSVNGGSTPRWKRDGSELFYVSRDSQLMSVPITRSAGGLKFGTPVRLFQSRAFQGNPNYDVTGDDRFLVSVPMSAPQDNSIAVIVNWPATIKP